MIFLLPVAHSTSRKE